MEVKTMNGVNYAEALVKARRYEMTNEGTTPQVKENSLENVAESVLTMLEKNEIVPVPGTEKVDRKIGQKVKIIGKNVANYVKKHPGKTAAAGAGLAAVGVGTAIAAKKIADKKKAAKENQEEVKENYEYEEYETLVENVIGYFMSEEEIMSENASEIATATADYFIENIDNM